MSVSNAYFGLQLLFLPPDAVDGTSFEVAMDVEEFEGDSGSKVQQNMGGVANVSKSHTFSFPTRAAFKEFEDFLTTVTFGRYGKFWMPSWSDDFEVLSGTLFDLTVKWCGFTAKVFPSIAQKRVLVNKFGLPNSYWGRLITGSVDNGNGTETITATLDFPYDTSFANLPSAQGHRTMYLHLCRLSSDDVEVRYFGRDEVEVEIHVVTIPEEG